MPTYQYACTQCDERLEAVQSFSDAPLTECPVCGGRLRKVFSAVGVVFKGSGFYKTDSRSTGKATGDGAARRARQGQRQQRRGKDGAAAPAAKSESTSSTAKPATPAPAAKSA